MCLSIRTDRKNYDPSDLKSPCYIMEDGDKTYEGPWTLYFNETDNEDPLYSPGI